MRKFRRLLLFLGILIIISLLTNRVLKSNNSDNLVYYLDDKEVTDISDIKEIIYVDKIVCDNGTIGSLKEGNIFLSNLSRKSNCKIYYKTGTVSEKTKSLLDTSGRCHDINSDGSVNVTDAEAENSLVCKTTDSYGDSYYYRGNVINNYVYFGGFYWRIIRINGDDSIRIIYDGTLAHVNGEASTDRILSKKPYNSTYNDNVYVGYMYGKVNASNYQDAHANVNSSDGKKYLETWYEENFKEKYSNLIADNIFCNDRSISTYLPSSSYNNLGYGKNTTAYRWAFGPWNGEKANHPTLICPQQNDCFTVNDTSKGNGALTEPIGLISMDEVILAGGYNKANTRYYLYTGNVYFTMSPWKYEYSSGSGMVTYLHGVAENGNPNNWVNTNGSFGIKPVINLQEEALKYGDGSINNPYRVE